MNNPINVNFNFNLNNLDVDNLIMAIAIAIVIVALGWALSKIDNLHLEMAANVSTTHDDANTYKSRTSRSKYHSNVK